MSKDERYDVSQHDGITDGEWHLRSSRSVWTATHLLVEDEYLANLSKSTGVRFTDEDVDAIVALPQILDALKKAYEMIDRGRPPSGIDVWGKDPNYDRRWWREEVVVRNTHLGYWRWVTHQQDIEKHDAERDASE